MEPSPAAATALHLADLKSLLHSVAPDISGALTALVLEKGGAVSRQDALRHLAKQLAAALEEEEAPTDVTAPSLIKAGMVAEEPAPVACATEDTAATDAAPPAAADQDAASAVHGEPVAAAFEALAAAAAAAAAEGEEAVPGAELVLEQEQQPEDVEERGPEGAASAEADAEADAPLEPAADEPPLGEADAEADVPGAEGSAVALGGAAPVEEAEAEAEAAV